MPLRGCQTELTHPILEKYSDRYSTLFLRAIEHSLRQNFRDRPQTVQEWRAMFTDPSVNTSTGWRLSGQSRKRSPGKNTGIPMWTIGALALACVVLAVIATILIKDFIAR